MTDAQSPLALIRRITVGFFIACALISLTIVWIATRPAGMNDAQALAGRLDEALPERAVTHDRSLVVLPFVTAEEDLEYLTFGLGDAVADELRLDPRLRVSGRKSAQSVAQAGLDVDDVGRVLNVTYVLRGSLRSEGERLTVEARLLDSRSGEPHWEQHFDVVARDFQRLAIRIGHRTSAAILPGYLPRMAGPRAEVSSQAYVGYQRAVYLARRNNPKDLTKSIELLDEVLALEPDYADAMIQRVRSRSTLHTHTGEVSIGAVAQSASELADKLQALDPANPDAFLLRVQSHLEPRDWGRKIDWLRQARDVRPGDPTTLKYLAQFWAFGGYVRHAAELARQAAEIDPLSGGSHQLLALIYMVLGEDELSAAHAELAEELGLERESMSRGVIALRQGDVDNGLAELRTAYSSSVEFDYGWMVPVAAALKDPSRRAAAVRALDEVDAEQREWTDNFMIYYPRLGDADRTLHALHAQIDFGMWGLWVMRLWSPELSSTRGDPRFAEVIKRLEFDVLWDAEGPPDRCERPVEGGPYRCT